MEINSVENFVIRCYALLTVLLFGGTTVIAQSKPSVVIESVVLDSVSKNPLCYVNIGITDKNIGTVSNLDGIFSLEVPDSLADEKITFSMIGYSNRELSISEINNDSVVFLSPSVIELKPAEITSKKLKERKTGNTFGNGVAIAVNAIDAGGEIGTVIKMPNNKKSYLKDFNFNISANNPDSAVFRLNLYYIENETFINIVDDNIYFTLHNGTTGDISIDLSQYQIVVDRDIFTSIELLEIHVSDVQFEENDPDRFFYDRINVSASLIGTKTYIRQTSQGKWNKKSFSPCFWMTILY